MPVASHRSCDIGRPCTRSSLAVISETTRPAPSDAAKRRNGASVTPDIGARNTRLANSTPPTFNGTARGIFGPVTGLLVHAATASLRLPVLSCAQFLGSQGSCLHFRQFYKIVQVQCSNMCLISPCNGNRL